MISSKQENKPKTSELEDVVFTETNLKGDWSNVLLLILMYTMQGLCLGVASSISILLKSKNDGTYYEQVLPKDNMEKFDNITTIPENYMIHTTKSNVFYFRPYTVLQNIPLP